MRTELWLNVRTAPRRVIRSCIILKHILIPIIIYNIIAHRAAHFGLFAVHDTYPDNASYTICNNNNKQYFYAFPYFPNVISAKSETDVPYNILYYNIISKRSSSYPRPRRVYIVCYLSPPCFTNSKIWILLTYTFTY